MLGYHKVHCKHFFVCILATLQRVASRLHMGGMMKGVFSSYDILATTSLDDYQENVVVKQHNCWYGLSKKLSGLESAFQALLISTSPGSDSYVFWGQTLCITSSSNILSGASHRNKKDDGRVKPTSFTKCVSPPALTKPKSHHPSRIITTSNSSSWNVLSF